LVQEQPVLGVDIGGSSIKFCLFQNGRILADATKKYESGTSPSDVERMIFEIVKEWAFEGDIGIGFPGIVDGTVIIDAPNLGHEWERFDLVSQVFTWSGGRVRIINDADAAALAMAKQTPDWEHEDILCLTLGTGIGSAWLRKGELDAGTEFGRIIHPELNCSLEQWASVKTLNEENLSMETWAERLISILDYLYKTFNPDRFILCGGITNSSAQWVDTVQTEVAVPVSISTYGDLTGAVGAARLHSV
jgi:polyphosphate glucokinase